MENNYDLMFKHQALLLKRLEGKAKKEFYITFFTNCLMRALKNRRQLEGLNQVDVAKVMGVRQSRISKIENLEKVPTIETIAKYCYALNFQVDEIRSLANEIASNNDNVPNFDNVYVNYNRNWKENKAHSIVFCNYCNSKQAL